MAPTNIDLPFVRRIAKKTLPDFPGICYQCCFASEAYSDEIAMQLLKEDLHASLHQSVVKRRSEFIAGRYLARQALLELGESHTSVPPGENRAPQWPGKFIGSITHTDDLALCAVAKKNKVIRLGIDIENILEDNVAKEIAASIVTQSEYQFVGPQASPDKAMLTLIFSAKESLFKALYPEVGYYFDFDVAKTTSISLDTGRMTLELNQDLNSSLLKGTGFGVFFEMSKQRVFTAVYNLTAR